MNTHEALIDEITWNRVQVILKKNKKSAKPKLKKDKTIPLFSGKVKCADCNALMSYTYSKSYEYKSYYKYRCSTYNNQGKTACSYHSILEDELKAIVLLEIQKFSNIVLTNEDEMIRRLIDLNSNLKLRNNSQIERRYEIQTRTKK